MTSSPAASAHGELRFVQARGCPGPLLLLVHRLGDGHVDELLVAGVLGVLPDVPSPQTRSPATPRSGGQAKRQ